VPFSAANSCLDHELRYSFGAPKGVRSWVDQAP
jgi:hypothetical protein